MQGMITIIRSYQKLAPPTRITLSTAPDLALLRDIVGGDFELIHGFDVLIMDDAKVRCRAFCNEHGKLNNLRFNGAATLLWHLALREANPMGPSYFSEYLAGDVAVVTGDDEFFEALR